MKEANVIIQEAVTEIVGEDAALVAGILKHNPNLSEFKLADAINKDMHETRGLLYKLYNINLASFMRRKDRKKGWYIYYWKLQTRNVQHVLQAARTQKMEVVLNRLERERTGNFYICQNGCMRLDLDTAFEFEFKCPECGSILNQEDNTEKIKALEDELKKLKRK